MRFKEEERKYKSSKTTELLDFIGQDISYEKDKERDKQEDMKVELEQRNPFMHIKQQMDRLNRSVSELRDAVEKLLEHKHTQDGNTVVDIKKSIRGNYV